MDPNLPPSQPYQPEPNYFQPESPLSKFLKSRTTIIIGLSALVILILSSSVFLFGKSSTSNRPASPTIPVYVPPSITPTPIIYPTSYPDETSTPEPSVSVAPITTTLKTYNGNYVTFKYPAVWEPKVGYVGGGTTLENITLGIPNVSADQTVSFSDVTVTQARNNTKDIVKETSILIGGKKGYKWIRKGTTYTSYDYITSGYLNQGSFTIHVTLSEEDSQIETLLDELAASVKFK